MSTAGVSRSRVLRAVVATGLVLGAAACADAWADDGSGRIYPAATVPFDRSARTDRTTFAVQPDGQLVLAEPGRVLRLSLAGTTAVFAGSARGKSGFSGDGGAATSALLGDTLRVSP